VRELETAPFRKWSFLEVVDGTFHLLRSRFVPLFFCTFLIVGLFEFVYYLVHYQISESIEPFSDSLLETTPEEVAMEPITWLDGLRALFVGISFFFSYLFLFPLMRVAVSWITIRKIKQEAAVTTGEGLKQAWHQGLPALLTHWMKCGGMLAGALTVTLILFMPFALLGLFLGEWAVALVLTGIAAALFVTPLAIWVLVRLSLVFPVMVEEQLRYLPALKRSWRLTRGSFWRLFFFYLLLGSILIGFITVAWFFINGIWIYTTTLDWPFLWAVEIAAALGMAGLTCLFDAALGVLATVLYFYQRIRREGLDLEQTFWLVPPAEQATEQSPTG
jgi:membrane-anchored glycerophosphoryl diester phosphodiesterase (GDPDase)